MDERHLAQIGACADPGLELLAERDQNLLSAGRAGDVAGREQPGAAGGALVIDHDMAAGRALHQRSDEARMGDQAMLDEHAVGGELLLSAIRPNAPSAPC